MRGRSPNKIDYTIDHAREDLANGVHFGVVSCRFGVSEADLAWELGLSAEDVLEIYRLDLMGLRQ